MSEHRNLDAVVAKAWREVARRHLVSSKRLEQDRVWQAWSGCLAMAVAVVWAQSTNEVFAIMASYGDGVELGPNPQRWANDFWVGDTMDDWHLGVR